MHLVVESSTRDGRVSSDSAHMIMIATPRECRTRPTPPWYLAPGMATCKLIQTANGSSVETQTLTALNHRPWQQAYFRNMQPSQENIGNYSQEELELYYVPSHHYTYFDVAPPYDRQLQCICAHALAPSDLHMYNRPDDYIAPDQEEDDEEPYFCSLRCTNAISEYEYAGGWRLCPHRRPPADVAQERANQVVELARDYIGSTDRRLHQRLHYGQYRVDLISRLQHMAECQCPCQTCSTPGHDGVRGPRDFVGNEAHYAHYFARTDVDNFISGDSPWPSRTPTILD